jgi:hypothetical protein
MASEPDSPESSAMRKRLNIARTVSENEAMSRVQGLLDMGMQLLAAAKQFNPDSRTRTNCLNGAKRCQSRIEEDIWRFQEPSEFAQLTVDVDRLNSEISELS